MKFFQLDDLDKNIVNSSGLSINIMVKIFEKLDKLTKYKKVNDLSGHSIVIINGNDKKINATENQSLFNIDKNTTVAILNGHEDLSLSDKDKSKVIRIFNGNLNLANSVEELNKLYNEKVINLTDAEKKVYDWLDQDKGGTSSYTMLVKLFPNIEHDYLEEIKQSNGSHPRDLDDFSRCIKFLNVTEELRGRLPELSSLSKEWSNLVKEWNTIEKELNSKNYESAGQLFSKCVEKVSKLKM